MGRPQQPLIARVWRFASRRRLRRLALRFSTMALALTFLLGVVRAGTQYFYCPMMDVVVSEHCCAPTTDHKERGPSIEAPDCCQARHVESLPTGNANVTTIDVAAAPFVCSLLPLPRIALVNSLLMEGWKRAVQRAGPPIRTGAERAARLQVFLI